jgi:glycosyltransferase involved in cell wall biosynthesis
VTLLVSGWPNAAGIEHMDGMEIHRVGGRHTYFLRAAGYYRRVLRDRGFDLVLEDLNKVPLFSTYWAAAPVVLLVHHLFGSTAFQEASLPIAAGTWALERPIPFCYRNVPVQAVSRSTADDLERRGFQPGRITVIPNGVDLDFYRPDASDPRFAEPTLLYLGRLKRYKRIDLILKSLALLHEQGVPARLIVAGKGDAAEGLRRLASELNIAEHVSMPGYVDEGEKRSLFRRSWVHVLTSPKEGWGISNLEAAACGTPTVASDSPGLRDSVVDGETGYLVPHGDVAALAGRLRHMLEDAILRERLGTAARRFALEFSWDRAAERTDAHLRSVLST